MQMQLKKGLAERNGSLGEKKIQGEKHREKIGGKKKRTTAVKYHSHTLGVSHSKQEEQQAGEMTHNIRKVQSAAQVLFIPGGFLN